jgi:GTP-binding protein YchF
MQLGIIGLPQSGKTTLFNALTRGDQPTGIATGKIEVKTGVVSVPDHRVERLAEIYQPKKYTFAKVTYADIAGLDGKSAQSGSGISGVLLNELTQMDGFIHVIRCFEDDNVPHLAGSVDPLRDIDTMDSEFMLNDLIMVERKLERLADERRKGGGRDRSVIDRELALFERFQTFLNEEKPLRDLELNPEETKLVSGFGFLSRKPVLLVLNLAEGQEPPEVTYEHCCSKVVSIQGKLEMDIAQLPPDEAEVFLAEYGIEEPSLNRVIRLSHELLGLISFFTVGPDEVRAWTLRKGKVAPEAAGVVHTDFQTGFIRAETIDFDTLSELGSMAEAKAQGKLRLEGKEYVVQDGEILTIRFNN